MERLQDERRRDAPFSAVCGQTDFSTQQQVQVFRMPLEILVADVYVECVELDLPPAQDSASASTFNVKEREGMRFL